MMPQVPPQPQRQDAGCPLRSRLQALRTGAELQFPPTRRVLSEEGYIPPSPNPTPRWLSEFPDVPTNPAVPTTSAALPQRRTRTIRLAPLNTAFSSRVQSPRQRTTSRRTSRTPRGNGEGEGDHRSGYPSPAQPEIQLSALYPSLDGLDSLPEQTLSSEQTVGNHHASLYNDAIGRHLVPEQFEASNTANDEDDSSISVPERSRSSVLYGYQTEQEDRLRSRRHRNRNESVWAWIMNKFSSDVKLKILMPLILVIVFAGGLLAVPSVRGLWLQDPFACSCPSLPPYHGTVLLEVEAGGASMPWTFHQYLQVSRDELTKLTATNFPDPESWPDEVKPAIESVYFLIEQIEEVARQGHNVGRAFHREVDFMKDQSLSDAGRSEAQITAYGLNKILEQSLLAVKEFEDGIKKLSLNYGRYLMRSNYSLSWIWQGWLFSEAEMAKTEVTKAYYRRQVQLAEEMIKALKYTEQIQHKLIQGMRTL